ncbi:MAG TPA: POTRA domain-containing protein [Pyrinomonadaceae bacterium]|nr:POTRA domain-containing protein [Pyrinomonadaceae bacterium]
MPLFAPRGRKFLLALLFALAAATPVLAQQTLKLTKIEFKGLERITEAQALEKAGLQPGQSAVVDDVEAAANRLVESGLFKNLSYQIKGTTDAAVVTFTVIENKPTVPVVFDNFVWFTDEELNKAVRARVPNFDGTAPETGGATEQIAKALQDLLRERKIQGTVEYTSSATESGANPEFIYTVKGAGLRVCRLTFPGARALTEEQLVGKSGQLFSEDYSRVFTKGFADNTLLPLYHERGYLRASFAPPSVKPDPSSDCEGGLAVTLSVDEGSVYVWDRAEWSGNEALTAEELNAALGMRPKEVANGLKIENAFKAVRKAYGRKGYLTAGVKAAPEFDDANRRVAYRVQVKEGPQYRMGDLTIAGLPESDINNLRGRWRLLHSEVYDEGYLAEFLKKGMGEFFRDAVREGRKFPPLKPVVNTRADREKLLVHVSIEFKPDDGKK